MVITRFAPSPTGLLHIGGVRTILFNYLFARHMSGKFLLRIEDTDRERSKPEYVDNILNTMRWLGLQWDDEPVFQSKNSFRHSQIAHDLLAAGKAYRCYCTNEDLEQMRANAVKAGQTPRYDRRCRDLKEILDKPFVIRLKAPLYGKTEFTDLIQGRCCVDNEHMDDMILLRSDGAPTYMLAVVVDDHDMNITHVIRANEHLNNTYRQKLIYEACDWQVPNFAHVSLIHGEDGAKLSKRHGAPSLDEYKSQGFLPEAILNYLLRLGFSKGEEVISMDECIKIFDITTVNPAAARFSLDKLLHVNSVYLRALDNYELLRRLREFAGEKYDSSGWSRVQQGLDGLKTRVRTLQELDEMSNLYGYGAEYYGKIDSNEFIRAIAHDAEIAPWQDDVETWLRARISQHNTTLKDVSQPLRVALTKHAVAPSIFEMMQILGPEIVAARLNSSILGLR
jgi:glutamyl-tRNA synthetase